MKASRFPLVWRILVGFALGIALGLAASRLQPETLDRLVAIASPFGAVLVSMLKMVVYPIIFFSLVLGAASMPLRSSGRIGGTVGLLVGIPAYTVIRVIAIRFFSDKKAVRRLIPDIDKENTNALI